MKLVSAVSDRVMAMADGKMLLIGTPQEGSGGSLKYCVHIWVIRYDRFAAAVK